MPLLLHLAASMTGPRVWWWVLGIAAVIGLIWWWSAAASTRSHATAGAGAGTPLDPAPEGDRPAGEPDSKD
jgi:hypothetical protein